MGYKDELMKNVFTKIVNKPNVNLKGLNISENKIDIKP